MNYFILPCQVPAEKVVDIALVSRLQNRIKELERDRKRLHRDLDSKGLPADLLSNDPEQEIYDTIRVSHQPSVYVTI